MEPNFDQPLKPISDLAGEPDFPQCAIGALVDIGDTVGVVVAVVKNSIKLKTREGTTLSFNFHALRRLYAPRPADPPPLAPESPPLPPAPEEPPLDFDRDPTRIQELVQRAGYPSSAMGELVDINGYVGVVVSLENQSMKVRSREGTSRKYNVEILRKLHGAGAGGG
jgi:hypothetical protein